MESKEKAEELVNKFKPYMYPFGAGSAYLTGDIEGNNVVKDAKECALICVDEIIKEIKDEWTLRAIHYWDEVKEEINKL